MFGLPSSPDGPLGSNLPVDRWGRTGGLLLTACLDSSLIGICLRTSGPPKDPEPSVPCKSLSV